MASKVRIRNEGYLRSDGGFSRTADKEGAYVQYGLGGHKGFYGEHIYGDGNSQELILPKSGNQGPSIDAKDFAADGFGVVMGWIKNIIGNKQSSPSSKEDQNEEPAKQIDENLKAENPRFDVSYTRETYEINKEGDTTSTYLGRRKSYGDQSNRICN